LNGVVKEKNLNKQVLVLVAVILCTGNIAVFFAGMNLVALSIGRNRSPASLLRPIRTPRIGGDTASLL